jgi:hypothetical protein
MRTALSSHIVARLLAERACPSDGNDDGGERASYELCLAAWGAWLVEWRLAHETDADVSARREDVFFQLIHALCTSCPYPQRCDEESSTTWVPARVRALCAQSDEDKDAVLFYLSSPPLTCSLSKPFFFFLTVRGRC